jgi:hypothetical protein
LEEEMAKDPVMSGPVSEVVQPEDEGLTRSEIINLFGEAFGRMLLEAGYASILSLQLATDEELLSIAGLGPAKLQIIRDEVGAQQVAADEGPMAELADLPEYMPDLPPDSPSSAPPKHVGPRTGRGQVSVRLRRLREKQAKKAEEKERKRLAIIAAETGEEPEPEVVEIEAEIEVVEEADPAVEPEEVADIDEVVDAEIEDDPTGQVEETLEEIAEEDEPEPEVETEEVPDAEVATEVEETAEEEPPAE